MKRVITKFSLIGIITMFLFTFSYGQSRKGKEKIVEPTAKEAIKQVILNGDIRLSVGKNCQDVGASPTDKTILDYLSGILANQAEPKTENFIEFKFKQEKGRLSEIIWICDLLFKGKDAEDVWSNGVRFKLRNSDRKLLRESLSCIGTG
ncbi:MAG: hypothetical protein K1X72_12245 [Pyrinomonadaceae bacterium]|nr:hypothetical protein [Pyrinomonadaceae bacterium]